MTTTEKRVALGTDLAPAGVTNLLGARPGTAAMHGFDGPGHINQTRLFFALETTHDALQQVIVPPPLEVDRDAAPVLTIMPFTSPQFRGRDGRVTPYTGFAFFAPVKHGGVRGQAGWEFIDGADHDKTQADMLPFTGQVYGMLKKFADIGFFVNGEEVSDLSLIEAGDDIEITVDRKRQRLVTLKLRVTGSSDQQLSAGAGDMVRGGGETVVFGVREIPTVDYKGYVDRSIVASSAGDEPLASSKTFNAEPVSVEFGISELEALDLLEVRKVLAAGGVTSDVPKSVISDMYVVEQLPLDV